MDKQENLKLTEHSGSKPREVANPDFQKALHYTTERLEIKRG